MNDWKEVSNWEACKAYTENKDVEVYLPSSLPKRWAAQDDWDFDTAYSFRIKTPDPARLLGKTIWTKDGMCAQILYLYGDKKYWINENLNIVDINTGWLTTEQIEKEFDIKD